VVGCGAGRFELRIGQTNVVLCADGTVWLPDDRVLLAADLHLGKGSSFRARSVPVPTGATSATLAKLTAAIERQPPTSVVILGDLWHARDGCTPEVVADLQSWMAANSRINFQLVIGNHDRNSGLPKVERLEVRDTIQLGDLRLQHEPFASEDGRHVIAGHIHPGCNVAGRGGQSYRLPCFWHTSQFTVLPAFGEMTGQGRISPEVGDRVVALAEGQLIEIPVPEQIVGRFRSHVGRIGRSSC